MPPGPGYTILIDGYNVLKRHPQWTKLPLMHARQQLLLALSNTRWPVAVHGVAVVFDSAAPPEVPGSPSAIAGADPGRQVGPIRVVFACPSADADIQARIRQSDHPDRLVVVSDDREIVQTAKSHGARHYSVEWLLQRSQPRRESAAPAREKPLLTPAERRRINAEVSRHFGLEDD